MVVHLQEAASGSVATVVLRSSTEQLLDDLERAVDDGVNTYKARSVHICSASYDYKWLHFGLHCHTAANVEMLGVSTWRRCACMLVMLLMGSRASTQLVSHSLLSVCLRAANAALPHPLLFAASCAVQ